MPPLAVAVVAFSLNPVRALKQGGNAWLSCSAFPECAEAEIVA